MLHSNFSAYRVRVIVVIVLLNLLLNLPVWAQNSYKPVYTVQNVPVNYTLPKNALAPDEPVTVTFSKEPTDEEIFRAHFFEEPLIPSEGRSSAEESNALVLALAVFSQRTSVDDFSAITAFLKQYPETRWRAALLGNLGILYRKTGYYNLAMDAWQQAWSTLKNEKHYTAKNLADRVIAELLTINCWVGRRDEIASLLKEIEGRVIEGSAAEWVLSCKTALEMMTSKPGISFKCGPYALNKIYTLKDSTKFISKEMMDAESTPKGFSLTELNKMAKNIGLNYQIAYRAPGAPVIEKAVVHWKLDHYSALIKMDRGHYRCEDLTAGGRYGQQFWLTPAALDSSASGYFLVPAGSLPAGWRTVPDKEGSQVFGKGVSPPDPGGGTSCEDKQSGDDCSSCTGEDKQSGDDCSSCTGTGLARCNVHLAAVSLHIFDKPFFYSTPNGPSVNCNIHYHQRDISQPANFNYSNFGKLWTFGRLSYIQDDPNNTSANADLYVMRGGTRTFTGFSLGTDTSLPELQTDDVLIRISGSCYQLNHNDGSKEFYSRPDGNTAAGRKVFLTKIVDAAGNALTISYDNSLRIVALQDATGQVTTLKYENADIFKITKIIALGRSATFEYDASGRLQKITDMIGMSSSFEYDEDGFITQMATPYGITKFTKQDGPGNFRAVQIDYPLGAKERIEFKEQAPGIPSSETVLPAGMNLFNSFLDYRNTFYWGKKQMLDAPGDYTKATIYHWMHGSATTHEDGHIARLLESVKRPLENREWYNYQNNNLSQSANQGMSARPSVIGRVLSDGSTQLYHYGYNSSGKDTLYIDPSGRKTSFKYDSTGIHLLEIRQTTNGINELLAKFVYDSQHPNLIKTATDASGQKTSYTYNAAGQLLTETNPRKEKTTYTYDGSGLLKKITRPVAGAVTTFTYDGFGRVKTITDEEGYTIKKDYDALDRNTLITFPDSTFKQIVYDRLDAVTMKDRLGRFTHYIYDSLDRLNVISDPLGRITQFLWCACGNLSELVDPLKRITSFEYDLQSRLVSKIYDDGKAVTYKYDGTADRLIEVTDAKGQTTRYTYFVDNNLKQQDYVNTVVATASVSYSYDSKYNRLDTMIDGVGITSYSYYPVKPTPVPGTNMIKKVDGPFPNDDIVYTYDSLGRVLTRSIHGVVSSNVYDALGRVVSSTNILGTFGYDYVHTTNRLAKVTNPNSTTTAFTYFDNIGDQRLKQILHKKGSTTLSKFNYQYNDEGQITKWIQQAGGSAAVAYDLGYDPADQLTSATGKIQSSGQVVNNYAYTYDAAGNRTAEQVNNGVTSALFNTLNQVTAQQDGGPMRFAGKVNEFSSVLVRNKTTADTANAPVDSLTNSFEAFVKVAPGVNNKIFITATDYSGNNNKNTDTFNIAVQHGSNNALIFDDNGNLITETNPSVSYGWDAADRLVKITQAGKITEFIYDGLSRRIAEKLNGTIIKTWLWCGAELCEERNAGGGTVSKRFFPQGEQIGTNKFYFSRDHLGSIREMTDAGGNIKARYDYYPYGKRTKLTETINTDFGFTGHYYDSLSGLHLALYRAYDANLGIWLNRDPIMEKGGLNLYQYVNNNSINNVDPLGLVPNPFNAVSDLLKEKFKECCIELSDKLAKAVVAEMELNELASLKDKKKCNEEKITILKAIADRVKSKSKDKDIIKEINKLSSPDLKCCKK